VLVQDKRTASTRNGRHSHHAVGLSPERIGQLLFASSAAFALLIYKASIPHGLPWNSSAQDAAIGVGPPLWLYFVQVFNGHFVALSCVAAAVATGLLCVVANRLVGMRPAIGLALIWIFLPPVWYRAVTGERAVCLWSACVIALWIVQTALILIVKKLRAGITTERQKERTEADLRRARLARIAGFSVMGCAALFALASASQYDDRLGEVASAYAQGVFDEAAGRVIVLNGICDLQFMSIRNCRFVSMRADENSRAENVAFARKTFPADTNLVAAARIGTNAFLAALQKQYPEQLYHMDGRSTTLDGWERRWSEFTPYLHSSDPFVPVARHLFACEGNAVAGRLQNMDEAWALYRRICNEVECGNREALACMNEAMLRGYKASEADCKFVREALINAEKSQSDGQTKAETLP